MYMLYIMAMRTQPNLMGFSFIRNNLVQAINMMGMEILQQPLTLME
ncbi:hypothetical protein G9F72_007340 [Clostridium estertheticum]|nr:hypothetical protein [Clostridium estertheticum]MBZ9686145.1 hypothetical protein [Clostridium estertheticum]